MTNVVKGAGRAKKAANARHQQRTPLPARPTQVAHQAALEDAAESPRSKLAYARALERENAAAEARTARANPGQVRPTSKPGAFAAKAEELGWVVSKTIESTAKTASCARQLPDGTMENVTITWDREVFQPDSALHSFTGHTGKKVRNAAEGYRLLAVPADAALATITATARTPRRERTVTTRSAPKRRVPFDPAMATDEEVLEAVKGRRVTWHNDYTEDWESGTVPDERWETIKRVKDGKPYEERVQVSGRHTKITLSNRNGKRILTFTDANGGGFRSLYVEDIERVS